MKPGMSMNNSGNYYKYEFRGNYYQYEHCIGIPLHIASQME